VLVDLGDLRLPGWRILAGFLVFRVVRDVNLDQALLITHSWLPKLFLLLHCYGSPFHPHLGLLLLPALKVLSWAIVSESLSQLFWSATSIFGTFSNLGLVLRCFDRAGTW
jgi:hypothetical protein